MQCSIELIYSLFLEIKRILPKPIINGELERLAERIGAKWVYGHYPRLREIIAAASLALHGFLRPVEWMWLKNVDLASVPAEHMASLAACVTDRVAIIGVLNWNCDIELEIKGVTLERKKRKFFQTLNGKNVKGSQKNLFIKQNNFTLLWKAIHPFKLS